MRFAILAAAGALALAACDTADEAARESGTPAYVTAAIENPERAEEQRARDVNRRPAEILTYLGVKPGSKIIDLGAWGAYYSTMLSHIVGPEGHVYAANSPYVAEEYPGSRTSLEALAAEVENISYVEQRWDALSLPEQVDGAMMVLAYHDTAVALGDHPIEDRTAMNRAIFNALKPGGVYLVIDHDAETGSGVREVSTLHRIDGELVREEVLAAGFELELNSDTLRNPDDPRDQGVFGDLRGITDRFVFVFRKPG